MYIIFYLCVYSIFLSYILKSNLKYLVEELIASPFVYVIWNYIFQRSFVSEGKNQRNNYKRNRKYFIDWIEKFKNIPVVSFNLKSVFQVFPYQKQDGSCHLASSSLLEEAS